MNFIFFAFMSSLVATLGSLFFSEIMNFIPCSLCWYQRVFMYPLVFIFLVNLLYPDKEVFKYSFPLVIVGLILSSYHNLLVYKIIPDNLSPCISGVPCSVDYLNYFGFITIPFLAFISFLLIAIFLLLYKKKAS